MNWHLYSTPLEISKAQLDAFTARHETSFRPTQPLSDRIVSRGDFPHFEYEGDEGPSHWGDLSPGTAVCGTGTEQSPIDVPESMEPGPLDGVSFDYAAAPASIYDNGHTVQVNFTGGTNQITINNKDYSLLQFHFHKHSEHTIAGEPQPLEAHLVHRASDGSLAVLGTFFKAGAENGALEEVFDSMENATDVPAPLSEEIDPADILPSSVDGWSYAGSLTTPPCSEGVTWVVYSTVQTVSAAQLAAFEHEPSFRPAQDLNDREISSGN